MSLARRKQARARTRSTLSAECMLKLVGRGVSGESVRCVPHIAQAGVRMHMCLLHASGSRTTAVVQLRLSAAP